MARFNNRRKSVFAETYDPEEDDSDEGAPVVFPKSDAQRSRLADAVRGILLFRSLDAQQMQQVYLSPSLSLFWGLAAPGLLYSSLHRFCEIIKQKCIPTNV